MTRDEALLATRLILRSMREGASFNWGTEAEVYMKIARSQLGTLTSAKGFIGKLSWVGLSSEVIAKDPSLSSSDFVKWILKGAPEPDKGTGKVNCWEMVLFSAFKGGFTTKKRIEDMYNEAVKHVKAGTRSLIGDTIEIELRRGNEYVFDPKDPKSPEPLPGDIVIFSKAAKHTAISLGTKSGGEHDIISHWPPPDGSFKAKKTTIEKLLGEMGSGNVIKFWSPKW